MKKLLFATLLVAAATTAQAATSRDVESSAVVAGTIVLARDGTVQSATVEDAAKYGQPIADFVQQAALKWRFVPVLVDGEAVLAKSCMNVRVVLKKAPDGNYGARIKGASFNGCGTTSTDVLHIADGSKRFPPKYPVAGLRGRVQGTAYLSLHVGRDGKVTEAVAEQVNLGSTGPERILQQYREIFAESALKAARHWTYVIPTTGKLAQQDSWIVHTSVSYHLNDLDRPSSDLTWETYTPGPYTPAPWVDKPDMNAADAIANDGMRTEGAGPTLLSPLNQG